MMRIDADLYVVGFFGRQMVRNEYRRLRRTFDASQAHDTVGRMAIAFGTRVTP
jgi:hypothetical protein